MIYRFGACSLDTQTHELCRDGQLLPLQPKVFQVLIYLIEQCQRLITKQELLEHLWANQFVNDSVVARCIMAARKAIGDSPPAAPSILTLRGQGYRFICEITERVQWSPHEAEFVTVPTGLAAPRSMPLVARPEPAARRDRIWHARRANDAPSHS